MNASTIPSGLVKAEAGMVVGAEGGGAADQGEVVNYVSKPGLRWKDD